MSPEVNGAVFESQQSVADSFETFEKPCEQKIPVKNRLSRLALYHTLISESEQTSSEIAAMIGTTTKWVDKNAKHIGIEPTGKTEDEKQIYPPLTFELLQDERDWQRFYRQLPAKISCNLMAETLGRSQTWVRKTVHQLDPRPSRPKNAATDRVKHYPKKTLMELREIDLSTPLDDGWYTLADIIGHTGKPKNLVKSLMNKTGIHGEERRSTATGIVRMHYPPDMLLAVQNAIENLPKPAGTWLTYYEISSLAKKSSYWVEKLIKAKYSDKGEPRLDNRNHISIHYPPDVVEEIVGEAERLREYPKSGDYLTVYGLAVKAGKKITWVKERLKFIAIEPEKRIDGKNCLNDHYPPQTVEMLLALPEDILEQTSTTTVISTNESGLAA